jgi:hypothetical protein
MLDCVLLLAKLVIKELVLFAGDNAMGIMDSNVVYYV